MLYLEPLDLARYSLAKRMDVARQNIERLVRGEQALTANIAIRLARVFHNTSADFWMRLQTAHDVSRAELDAGPVLDEIEPIVAVP